MSHNRHFLARRFSLVLVGVLWFAAIITVSCVSGIGRISGTYVLHTPTDAAMLQITETDNGQLTGALSEIDLKADGKIESTRKPFTGVFDRPQVTLTFSELFGHQNVSGTVTGNSFELQVMTASGNMETWAFQRGSAGEFDQYAALVRRTSNSNAVNAALLQAARGYSQSVSGASSWLASSAVHVSRISGIEMNYRKLESQMESLIGKEHLTANRVDRSQLAVAVSQDDVAGSQFDIQVEQVWNGIMQSGKSLLSILSRNSGDCRISDADVKSRGASPKTIVAWRESCNELLSETSRFDSGFKNIADRYSEVKQVEAAAAKRRQALVSQANRLQ